MLSARVFSGVLLVVCFAAACGGGNGDTGSTNGTGGAGAGGKGTGAGTMGSGAGAAGTGGSGAGTTGTGGTTSAGGIFHAKEPWNTPVDQEPADPSSPAVIDWLAKNGGWGTGTVQIDFSITLQVADASTPMMPFTKSGDFYSPDCDDIPAFPVPAGGAIEGESGYGCTMDGDCHLLVLDPAHDKLYEMYRAFAPPDPSVFNGGCSVVWDLNEAYPANLRGDGCSSVDAGGFPVAAMLFTADEVAAGHIDHAIRFILPNARIRGGDVYVHPGTHTTSAAMGAADAPPYGVHFRLKPSFDLAKLPSDGARTIAKALQKYGMFLADGGNIALTAADDRFTEAKWADANVNVDSHALAALQVDDFEVVDMGTPMPAPSDCIRNP